MSNYNNNNFNNDQDYQRQLQQQQQSRQQQPISFYSNTPPTNMSSDQRPPRLHLATNTNNINSISNQQSKNPIKLTLAPINNNNYANLGSQRNTPLTPSSATVGSYGGSVNSNGYSHYQSLNGISNIDLLSPVNSQRPLLPHLYNNNHHHSRSSSSHLGNQSPFYTDSGQASPINTLPPLHLESRKLMSSNLNSDNYESNNFFYNSSNGLNHSIGSNSWFSPSQSPANISPNKNLPKVNTNSNNSIFQYQPQQLSIKQHLHQDDYTLSPTTPTMQQNSKTPFNSQLSTHYENELITSPGFQQELIPPSRAHAPVPYFSDSNLNSNFSNNYNNTNVNQNVYHKRGNSVGVLPRDNGFGGNNQFIYGQDSILQSPIRPQPPKLPTPSISSQNLPVINYSNTNIQIYNQNNLESKHIKAPTIEKVDKKEDLSPIPYQINKFRRASSGSKQISPLKALTLSITTSYSLCRPEFNYQLSRNPRRVLTKPSEPTKNNNFDNVNSDYILYVNDVLGIEDGKKYLVLDILGQGTFGQVVKCQNLLNKDILAVKIIKSDSVFLSQSLTEVSILETINNKIDPYDKHHFLRMKDKFVHKHHLCIAFELLSNNLYELIKQNQFNGLDMHLIKSFSKQLLSSLIVLKSFKIIHCDLKPENILLVSLDKPDLKIIDFGSACYERQTVYTYIQSRFYRSPEVILGLPYTCAIDMWSFGCIIAELFLGIPLLPGPTEYNQLSRIIKIFGYPNSWMIEMGKNSNNYLEKAPNYPSSNSFDNKDTSFYNYKLKSIEKYSKEFKTKEEPSTNYFEGSNLKEIIMNYQSRNSKSKNQKLKLTKNQINERKNLLHFLTGILNINPLERWTPQQAFSHPFINNLPYDESWTPLGNSSKLNISNSSNNNNNNNNNNSSSSRQRAMLHRRGQLSTSAINNNGSSLPHINGNLLFNKEINGTNGAIFRNQYLPPSTNNNGNEKINSFKFPLHE